MRADADRARPWCGVDLDDGRSPRDEGNEGMAR